MLFILAEKEEYFNNKDHGLKAFGRAKGPKKLVTIPGITHYGIYNQARPQAQKLAIAWFDEHLKGVKEQGPNGGDTAKDWTSYNGDVIGTRHNRGETAINAGKRRPARAQVAIPGGRLGPSSRHYPRHADRRRWICLFRHGHRSGVFQAGSGRQGALELPQSGVQNEQACRRSSQRRRCGRRAISVVRERCARLGAVREIPFTSATWGAGSTHSTARPGPSGGDLNARGKEFPGSHPINVFFASPIMADGKLMSPAARSSSLIAATPFYRGSKGRGFVRGVEPRTGHIIWKYDVGRRPKPLNPPITITDSWGRTPFISARAPARSGARRRSTPRRGRFSSEPTSIRPPATDIAKTRG